MGAEEKVEREREKSGTNPLLSDIYRVGIRNACPFHKRVKKVVQLRKRTEQTKEGGKNLEVNLFINQLSSYVLLKSSVRGDQE